VCFPLRLLWRAVLSMFQDSVVRKRLLRSGKAAVMLNALWQELRQEIVRLTDDDVVAMSDDEGTDAVVHHSSPSPSHKHGRGRGTSHHAQTRSTTQDERHHQTHVRLGDRLGQKDLRNGVLRKAAANDPLQRQKNLMWRGALHAASTMWGAMAELTEASRSIMPTVDDPDGVQPPELVAYVLDMLDTPLRDARQCGLGMLFSFPTHSTELAVLLLDASIPEVLVDLLREPGVTDFMQVSKEVAE